MNPFRVVALSAALTLSAAALPALAKSGAEWQALTSQASLSLEQAIEKAAQTVPGKPVEAELDRDGHGQQGAGLHYEVKLLTPANEEVDVHVNATNGEAALYKNKGKAKNKDVKRVGEAKVSLIQAIAAATAHTAGKAVEADLDSDWGKTSDSVKVLQADGQVMKIKLDALTGQVTGSKKD